MAAIVALTPSAPTKVSADTSSIQIAWTAPTDFGGTPLTNYKVEWNAGGSSTTYVVLYTSLDANTLTYTKGSLNAGETYKLRVSANNYVGYSLPSTEVSIIAATVPLTPDAPTKVSANIS
jgi:hypothetical protein